MWHIRQIRIRFVEQQIWRKLEFYQRCGLPAECHGVRVRGELGLTGALNRLPNQFQQICEKPREIEYYPDSAKDPFT